MNGNRDGSHTDEINVQLAITKATSGLVEEPSASRWAKVEAKSSHKPSCVRV